jgi:hypothetical protein
MSSEAAWVAGFWQAARPSMARAAARAMKERIHMFQSEPASRIERDSAPV